MLEHKPVFDRPSAMKGSSTKAPEPMTDEPAAKLAKLQHPDVGYRAEVEMQVQGDSILPPFKKRLSLFAKLADEEKASFLPQHVPLASTSQTLKSLDNIKPRFVQVCCCRLPHDFSFPM